MNELYSVVSQEQVEAEKLLIGAILRDPKALANVGFLSVDNFMVPEHQEFWNRIKNGEEPVEVVMAVPGMTKAFTWSNDALFGREQQYANALQDKAYIREAVRSAEAIVKAAMEGKKDDIQTLAFDMTKRNPGGYSRMRSPHEIAASLNRRIDQGNISIPFGIESMDDATRGLERGTLTTLAARPSMGKSSLAFQVNENQALVQGLRVGVFALEMSGEQMFARRNCHKVGAMWQDVRSENITSKQKDDLKRHIETYAEQLDGLMYISDDTSTTVAQIVRTQLRERFDVIMIDHLGLLKDKILSGERHDQYLGRLTETLHSLAKNTQSVVLLLAQLNRSVEARQDKRPHMGDLRDSGHIEQNSDNVGLLYGEWYYDPTADNTTEIIWGKFRDGLKNSLSLVEFDFEEQRFRSVDTEKFDEYAAQRMQEQYEQLEMPDDGRPF
jgi:replicative DNA helicase